MDAQQKTVAVKSTLAGVAGWYLARQLGLGRSAWRVGLGMAAFNVGSYLVTGHLNQDSWVTPRQPLSVTYNALKTQVQQMTGRQLFWVPLLLLGAGGSRSTYLSRAFSQGPLPALSALGKVCVFLPLAQEICFRGFVQEKIEDLQHHLRTPGAAVDLNGERRTRILIQAAVAALVPVLIGQRVNGFVLGFGGMLAYGLGEVKEDHGIHSSIALHGATSSLGAFRGLLLGG